MGPFCTPMIGGIVFFCAHLQCHGEAVTVGDEVLPHAEPADRHDHRQQQSLPNHARPNGQKTQATEASKRAHVRNNRINNKHKESTKRTNNEHTQTNTERWGKRCVNTQIVLVQTRYAQQSQGTSRQVQAPSTSLQHQHYYVMGFPFFAAFLLHSLPERVVCLGMKKTNFHLGRKRPNQIPCNGCHGPRELRSQAKNI